MSRGAVQAYGTDTLESMNAMGGGTNMPSLSFTIAGGIVPGYNGGGHVHAGPDMEPDVKSEGPAESKQNKEAGKADKDKDALTDGIVVPKGEGNKSPLQHVMEGNVGQGIKWAILHLLNLNHQTVLLKNQKNQPESGDGDEEQPRKSLSFWQNLQSL